MSSDLNPTILAVLRADPELLAVLRELPSEGDGLFWRLVCGGKCVLGLGRLRNIGLAVSDCGYWVQTSCAVSYIAAIDAPATCYTWRPDDGSEPEEWFRWPLREFLADPWDTSLPAWQDLVRQSIAGRVILAAPVIELTVEEVLAAASWGDLDNDVINILNAAAEEIVGTMPETGWFPDDKAARDDLLGRIVTAVTAWVETQPRPWREDKERVREVTAEEVAAAVGDEATT